MSKPNERWCRIFQDFRHKFSLLPDSVWGLGEISPHGSAHIMPRKNRDKVLILPPICQIWGEGSSIIFLLPQQKCFFWHMFWAFVTFSKTILTDDIIAAAWEKIIVKKTLFFLCLFDNISTFAKTCCLCWPKKTVKNSVKVEYLPLSI